jgi:hypothetical protein
MNLSQTTHDGSTGKTLSRMLTYRREKKPPSIYFILAIELKKSRKEMILQSSNE